MSEQSLRTPSPDLAPQSPAAAFERFIELVRSSAAAFDADPAAVLSLLRPFLANPNRDEPHVREIARAYGAAQVYEMIRNIPLMKQAIWLVQRGRLGGTMEQYAPDFIKRLRELEATLRTELRPGSITLNLKPLRYLDTPTGFGGKRFHRFRVQVQTLIDSTPDDALQAVTLELSVNARAADLVVDDIFPQAGFSVVGLKETAGLQVGHQRTSSEKVTLGAQISGVGAKVSSGGESASSEQASTLTTIGGEKTVARVEQYLIARKISNRAIWRALAGVGPVDAAGGEYTADVLIPTESKEVDVRVDARVEWLRVGAVPAELRRTIILPRPSR